LAIVKYLIEKGTEKDFANHYGDTPLHIASEKGFSELVDFYLKEGSNINQKNKQGWISFLQ